MSKLIKMLTLSALVGASISANSNDCNPCSTPCNPCGKQSNKTHMTPRSHGVNLALEYTDGWRDLITSERSENYGGNFQLGFFYEASTQGYELGRYFSPKLEAQAKDCSPCPSTCTPCSDAPACNLFTWGSHLISNEADNTDDAFTVDTDLNLRCFIQLPLSSILEGMDGADNGANFSQVLDRKYSNASQALKMDRQTYGFMLNYHQDLSNWVKGLYFKVNLPIAHVKNRIKCCLEATDWTIAGENTEDGTNPVSFKIASNDIKTMIQDYLDGDTVTIPLKKWTVTDNGSTSELADVVLQDKLCGCTIPCGCETTCEPCPSTCNPCDAPKSNKRHKSRTGVADIDVQIGYNFLNKDTYHHTIAFGFTIPTGSGPKTHRIWDAQVGYKDHWAVGFSANGDVRLWNDADQKIVLFHALNYRYLFSDCETRCLGICGENWGHFELLGKRNQKTLVPAANVLTTKVDVTLGSQVDYIIGLNYVRCGFSLDLGYNLFYRDAEEIDLKKCDTIFGKDTYAIPQKEFVGVDIKDIDGNIVIDALNNGTGFQAENRKGGDNGKWLSNADIDKSVAETPRQLSHKIFAGASYATKSWDIPFLVGVGGHYEFGDENTTLSSWGVNVKVAVAF